MRKALITVCLLAASSASQAAPPPVAEVRNAPTTLHGTVVPDPYRWLEDTKTPQAQTWMRAQGDATRNVLDRIDARAGIAKRLAELSDAQGDAFRSVMRLPGDRWYYQKRAVGEKQFKVVMRQGLNGAERVLVDPEEQAKKTGVPHAVNHFKPSWDGKYLAYGLSAGGSEKAELFVMEIATGKLLGQPAPRVQEALVHWLPDSRSFTYNQNVDWPAGTDPTEQFKDTQVLWQRVGGGAPKAVFGPTVTKTLGLERLDVAELITVPGSRYIVARSTDTTVPEGKLYVAKLADFNKGAARWRRIGSEADKLVKLQLQGDHLLVLTQAGAPHRKVVRVDLKRGDLAHATLVAAEPKDGVLEDFMATPSGLVTEQRTGTSVVLRRHVLGDTAGRTVPPPAPGAANMADNLAHDSEDVLYSFSSWTEPLRWMLLHRERSLDVALGRRSKPPGLPELTITDVQVPSHDGVKVPMTILHKKGLALDGTNPVWLNGYASYGSTISAGFNTEAQAWMERGGVVAYTNPRGSGVYGDEWHRAGFKATKPNTWKDGIACAKYLIAKGYGSAKTMGIMGTSAGGIFVGRAVTEAPELFAAAIFNVGVMDAVRAEESGNGATNISEFGTAKDPAEFKALLEMSTYHAIKDGAAYPGVLLVHGMNDPRVDVWHSSKTTARLQAAQANLPNARPALLRLDLQAGHGVGSTLTQRQAMAADMQAFMLWQMGKTNLRD
jgi:prolyl oligopeptidase